MNILTVILLVIISYFTFHEATKAEIGNNQETNTQNSREIELNLSQIIILALENNRDLKNAYLERIAQQVDLEVAEDVFVPDFTPRIQIQYTGNGTEVGGIDTSNNNTSLNLSTTLSLRIPTGGTFNFSWNGNQVLRNTSAGGTNTNQDQFRQNLQLSFNQPLLRGGGTQVNKAPVRIARLQESVNIQSLKSTLINTITSSILAYRNLLQAKEIVAIEKQSLERAKEFLTINQRLIEAGRRAPVEIVQSQTQVANREVTLLQAENNFESSMLNLIQILDIDKSFRIIPTETIAVEPNALEVEQLMALAFANRPDYLQAQLNQEIAQQRLLQAENNRLWDLNLNTSYRRRLQSGNSDQQQDEWTVGANLSRTLGDLTRQQQFIRRQINLNQATNTLANLRDQIEIQVIDQIRQINLSFKQVQLAIQARELSEQQLEVERRQLGLGRSSIFQIVNFQSDLAAARNNELRAKINYLNALTNLDRTLGNTLSTWKVTIEESQE